jgi:hypothetical protein
LLRASAIRQTSSYKESSFRISSLCQKGYISVRKEQDRLERFGWYEYDAHLPFWPVYSNAQGATPRKLEQRWRRTTEGGGPRHELYDADNLRAWSLNDASRRLHVPRHFLADNRDEMSTYLRARNLPPAPDDIARAIAATLRRSARYAEYRSLVGLLEHLRCVGSAAPLHARAVRAARRL